MKNNHAGFSLVELIVVMAIMAILVGALAPQYMKYVEKSRKSIDVRTLDAIEKAAVITSEEVEEYDTELSILTEGEYIITFSNGVFTGLTGNEQKSLNVLKKGIESVVGDLSHITLKHKGWGILQIHMKVENGLMGISYTNTGSDSYKEYISGS